jgi:hypothetical protein
MAELFLLLIVAAFLLVVRYAAAVSAYVVRPFMPDKQQSLLHQMGHKPHPTDDNPAKSYICAKCRDIVGTRRFINPFKWGLTEQGAQECRSRYI